MRHAVVLRLRFCGPCSGSHATLIRPTLQALLPSLARTPEEVIASNAATSTIESLGTLFGPLIAGVLVVPCECRASCSPSVRQHFFVGAAFLARVEVERRHRPRGGGRCRGRRVARSRGWVSNHRAGSEAPPGRFPDRCADLRPRLPQRPHRRRRIPGLRRRRGSGRLYDGGHRRRWPDRRARSADARRRGRLAVTFGLVARVLGSPDHAPGLVAQPRSRRSCLLAVVGAANSVEDVAVFTLLQRIVPNEMLTRVLGVLWALAMGGVAVGSIATPALVHGIGPRAAFRRRWLDPAGARPSLAYSTTRRDRPCGRAGPGARPDRAGADVRSALHRGEGARRSQPRPAFAC